MVSEGWTENLKSENGGTEAAENGEIKLFISMIARLFELWCNAPVDNFTVMLQWNHWVIRWGVKSVLLNLATLHQWG